MKVVIRKWEYLPHVGHLAIHKGFVVSLSGHKGLVIFAALHNKPHEGVVWRMGCNDKQAKLQTRRCA